MSYQKINPFERLILGSNPKSNSVGEFRRILLVGEMCLLILIISCLYSIVDYYHYYLKTEIIYLIVIASCVISFILNRTGRHLWAKIFLLSTCNLAIYLFSSSNIRDAGTYSIYFPLLLLAFAFFGYSELKYSILFAAISMFLFIYDISSDFSLFTPSLIPENYLTTLKTMNFIVSYATCLILVLFMVNTDHISELNLIKNQHKLNRLAIELKESELRYELAMTGTNAGLWDWDVKNNKIYHGFRWKEMLGYEKDDMNITIDDFYPLVHEEDVNKVRDALKDHFNNRNPFNIEYRIRKKDGSYEWFYDAGKAIWDETGKPIRMVGSIINITKRKQNEEWIQQQNTLLEKTNAELDRFVYITSHDLKAPLLSILGLINLAELSSSKAEVDLCLKMMKDRINGLEAFISDIINYSRNVRVGIVKETIDIKKIVSGIINEYLFMQNVDKIHFDVNVEPDIQFVSDEKRFSVIMKNLISNAIKYHNFDQTKPEILIWANKEGEKVIISIKDNGEGIDPSMQTKIFEMFFRGTEKSSGSGLGLYIVQEMLEKLQGSIKVNSAPGKGSEFILSLPEKL